MRLQDKVCIITGAGSNNIAIGSAGQTGNNRIQIGTDGVQTETFIAGIDGNTTTGGIAVFLNGCGEPGTLTSSRRFKEDIVTVGASSSRLRRPPAMRCPRSSTSARSGRSRSTAMATSRRPPAPVA